MKHTMLHLFRRYEAVSVDVQRTVFFSCIPPVQDVKLRDALVTTMFEKCMVR